MVTFRQSTKLKTRFVLGDGLVSSLQLHDLLLEPGRRDYADIRDRFFALIGMSDVAETFDTDYGQDKLQVMIAVFNTLDQCNCSKMPFS